MNRLFLVLSFLGILSHAHAQLDVRLEIKRNIYMRGEPCEATVTIRNLAGKDLMLADEGGSRWFGFQIMKGSDTPIAPFDSEYKNPPQMILAGGIIKRTVDLLRLYPINEFGSYTVRAAIYFQETDKYITSDAEKLDISEGRKLWSQTVGVPAGREGAGDYRVLTLLTFPHPKEMVLYARIEDERSGTLFGTYPLGRLLTGTVPGHELDRENTLHIFHMFSPGMHYLSKIGVNGEWMGQTVWQSGKGRSIIRRKEDGSMVIVGASRSSEKPPPGPEVPRLSDRPVTLPK